MTVLFVSLSEVEGAKLGLSHFDFAQCDNPSDVMSSEVEVGQMLSSLKVF
jgi:hypothetical protein